MKQLKYIVLFSLLLMTTSLKALTSDSLFYSSQYLESSEFLEKELGQGNDGIVYYNLALNYHKLGEKAKSIIAIERSFYHNPYSEDTRNVMAELYKRTNGVCAYDRGVLLTFLDNLIYAFHLTTWIVWALLFFFASMVMVILYFYFRGALYQRVAFYLFLMLLICSFLSNMAIAHQYYYHKEVEDLAIVNTEATIYSEPTDQGQEVVKVFQGNRLLMLENPADIPSSWQAVELPDDRVAYINKSALTPVIESIN